MESALKDLDPSIELGVGALTDAYPPEEEALGITRQILMTLSRLNRPFCVNTKSDLVCRDIEILRNHLNHCDVYISICSLDGNAVQQLEPGAPPVSRRLEAVRRLWSEGILVGIDASPWIPGISDAQALMDILPEDIAVQFAPLDVEHIDAKKTNFTFTQHDVLEAYEQEKKQIGERKNVIWKEWE